MSVWDDAPKNSEAVFDHLKECARLMRTTTYGEIATAIGLLEDREIAPISLRFPLAFIRDNVCRPNGLPWLNAIAVNASTGFPGDSFLPEGVAFGDDDRVLWRGTVLAVFAYPWDAVSIA